MRKTIDDVLKGQGQQAKLGDYGIDSQQDDFNLFFFFFFESTGEIHDDDTYIEKIEFDNTRNSPTTVVGV